MTRRRLALIAATPVLLLSCVAFYRVAARLVRDPIVPLYAESCARCHGENLEGTAIGTSLVGRALVHGDSVDAIARSVSDGFATTGMPA
jgi:hypothetical protein